MLTNYQLPDDLADEDEVQAVQDARVRQQEMFDSLSIMNTMIALMIGVAVMLGLVVLYNLSELSFVEKVREYTTLKVLGLQEKVIRFHIIIQCEKYALHISLFASQISLHKSVYFLEIIILYDK